MAIVYEMVGKACGIMAYNRGCSVVYKDTYFPARDIALKEEECPHVGGKEKMRWSLKWQYGMQAIDVY